jgi:hypothetical protein
VEAPMCVTAVAYQQPVAGGSGKRYVVQLLNEINTSAGKALPEMAPSMRSEIVPVGGIAVAIDDPAVTRATLQPEGEALAVEKTSQGVRIAVPRLALHSIVVAERE